MAKTGDYTHDEVFSDHASFNRVEQADATQGHSFYCKTQALFCKFQLNGTLTFVNQKYADSFQTSPVALVGRNIQELVPTGARANFARQLRALHRLTPDHPALTYEHKTRTPNGSVRWQRWTNLASFDAKGQILELQAVGHDITEEKTLYQALQKSEQQLNLFFNQSLDGFFFAQIQTPIPWNIPSADKEAWLDYVFDHMRITRANQAFLDQYLATEPQMLGRTPAQFFAHDLRAGRQAIRTLFDHGRVHAETEERRLDGTPILVERDHVCLYDGQGRVTGHFGVQREVTNTVSAVPAPAPREAKYRQSEASFPTALDAAQGKLLNDIVSAISDSLELKQILQRAADEMLATFQASRSLVILCHPTDLVLEHTTTAAVPHVESLQGARVPIQNNPYAQLVLSQEGPVVANDVAQDPLREAQQALAQAMDVGAILAVAIRYKGHVKGILSVQQCHTPRQWTEADQKLIKRVADHLAIAIQQAELYQHAQAELTERKRLEAQLRHEAFHDRLTTLPNRAFFLEHLSQALQNLRQNGQEPARQGRLRDGSDHPQGHPHQFAILFLDLDRFKVVNDSLGHTIGDRLLQIVAKRLRNCLQPDQIAARLGGDEFVVFVPALPTVNTATELARTIHDTLEAPILLNQHKIFMRASIGIAFSSPDYTDPSQLLRDADLAMYQAKDSNREYAIFNAPMHALAVEQMQLENDLRHAIEHQEFNLHYQPIVDLATGHLQGFEALVRWQHPRRGIVSPANFIPVAENTDLITEIDLWTLNQACHQLHQWHQQFPQHRNLTINVNLSGKQFVRSDLIQKIDQALATTGLPGRHLKLEITESVLIQNDSLAIDILKQLQKRQITVCMDDFGTGYSSLSYLHRFPVDVLKIDQSFISALLTEDSIAGDGEIVRAILSLAKSLDLIVVAEGIENLPQLQYLKANHCHSGQGYYYAKPMTAADVTVYLKKQSAYRYRRSSRGR